MGNQIINLTKKQTISFYHFALPLLASFSLLQKSYQLIDTDHTAIRDPWEDSYCSKRDSQRAERRVADKVWETLVVWDLYQIIVEELGEVCFTTQHVLRMTDVRELRNVRMWEVIWTKMETHYSGTRSIAPTSQHMNNASEELLCSL